MVPAAEGPQVRGSVAWSDGMGWELVADRRICIATLCAILWHSLSSIIFNPCTAWLRFPRSQILQSRNRSTASRKGHGTSRSLDKNNSEHKPTLEFVMHRGEHILALVTRVRSYNGRFNRDERILDLLRDSTTSHSTPTHERKRGTQ